MDISVTVMASVLVLLYAAAVLAVRARWEAGHPYTYLVAVVGAVVLFEALRRLFSRPSSGIDLVVYTATALAGGLFLLGCVLFALNHAQPRDDRAARHSSMTNLAVSLMTGGGIALVLFALERAGAERAERLQDEEFRAQQRTDFRLAVALAPDLTGFTPPRDPEDGKPLGGPFSMVGSVLNGKKLANATLTDVDLTGSSLIFTHLGGARMRSADLEDARMRGAYLRYADLRCACLANAVLQGADLSNTDLRGADLRGANLKRADLRGSYSDEATLWPAPELQAGICRSAGDGSCGVEARETWDVGHRFLVRTDPPAARDCEPPDT